MNTVDIIILVLLVPLTIQGLIKGFSTQVAAIVGLLLGVWASFRFSTLLSGWLQPYLAVSPNVLNLVSFVTILIVVIVLLALLGRALKGVLKFAMLGWLDKLLGAVFGLAKGALILGLLIMAFNAVNTKVPMVKEETLSGSVLYPAMLQITDTVFPYLEDLIENQELPGEIQDAV